MRKPFVLAMLPLLFFAVPSSAPAQVPGRIPSATRPASRPAPATTRPTSLRDAQRIVFLVDTRVTALMLPRLREELNLAVEHLRDDQRFTIVVCRPANLVPGVFNQNPVRATLAAKRAAADFVAGIDTEQKTNPVPGIRKAVEMEPDLLCFIPDDTTPQTDAVRQAFHPLRGRLNIVLFTGYIPHPVEFLRTLALEHGGVAMDQKGNVLEPPKPNVADTRKPESRPSVLER